jgi:hypothetical protein
MAFENYPKIMAMPTVYADELVIIQETSYDSDGLTTFCLIDSDGEFQNIGVDGNDDRWGAYNKYVANLKNKGFICLLKHGNNIQRQYWIKPSPRQ